MGQPLPLPERIPIPTKEQKEAFDRMGITIVPNEEGDHDPWRRKYVCYTLPDGWRMIKEPGRRSDFPEYVIVDSENMRRVVVQGVWKGTYDNELNMCVCETLEPYHVDPTAQFNELLAMYKNTCDAEGDSQVLGGGMTHVMDAYTRLEDFVAEHPEFKDRMPVSSFQ